ncbi:MAG: phosphatidate cytidylyltransferase [Roseibium sp.]
MSSPDNTAKKISDLGLRFVSAMILGPLVLWITYLGGTAYALLVLVAAVLFLWEWFSITGTKLFSPAAFAGYASLVGLSVFHQAGEPQISVIIVLATTVAAYPLARFSREGRWAGEGILYSGLALYSLLAIRSGSAGLAVTFFLFFVVWATDIFAYFVGRSVGGPKLWARISPKKTWSGAVGGLVLAVVFGVGIAMVFRLEGLFGWGLLAAGLSIVSQAGDLLESAIKRRFDVKDSSQLIPGHGGIMDRIDGLVAAAIFAVLVGLTFGGPITDPVSGLGL